MKKLVMYALDVMDKLKIMNSLFDRLYDRYVLYK